MLHILKPNRVSVIFRFQYSLTERIVSNFLVYRIHIDDNNEIARLKVR